VKHKITGNGPVIIILRGLGRTLEYWLDFETVLAKNFKVVMIDLPGVNDEKEKTPLMLMTTVKLLVKKINELKPQIGEPPYHFFGLSLGGLSAMGIAYYNPEMVETLTVASSSIVQLQSKRINLIPLLDLLLMELEPGRPPYPNRRIGKYLVGKKYLIEHPEIIKTWDKIWAMQELTKDNFFKQMISALFSITPEMASRIKTPTLVISGEDDRLVPFENSEVIKNCVPNAIHIRVPDAGHDITTEKPELIAEMISEFTKTKNLEIIKTKFQMTKEPQELLQLKRLERSFGDVVIMEEIGEVDYKGYRTPINAFFISHKPKPELPTIAFFSCFHGVEWIGGRVLVNFIEHLVREIKWDEDIKNLTEKVNICGIPIVNPVGRIEGYRSNGNGIDLMRNAPVRSEHAIPLLGGQKLSRHLPWYMGEGLEKENEIVVKFLHDYVFPSNFKMTIDIHSSFLRNSRIWIPYASGKKLPSKEAAVFRQLRKTLNGIYKYNPYKYEKQEHIYTTHGDFWDYKFDRHNEVYDGTYLPVTLEISSRDWTIKNFLKHWSMESLFSPFDRKESNAEYIKHIMVFDFLIRFLKNYQDPES